jgi:hypothetical protein
MVFLGDTSKLPAEVVRSVELWGGCVSGALEKGEYESLLRGAGFEDVSVEVTHTYDAEADLAVVVSRVAAATPRRCAKFLWPARLSGPVKRLEGEGIWRRARSKFWKRTESCRRRAARAHRGVRTGALGSHRVRMLGTIAGG